MQLTDQAPLEHVYGVVIQNAVVPLVTGREMDRLSILIRAHFRNSSHDFALSDVVRHQLFSQHVFVRLHCLHSDWRMQVKR